MRSVWEWAKVCYSLPPSVVAVAVVVVVVEYLGVSKTEPRGCYCCWYCKLSVAVAVVVPSHH